HRCASLPVFPSFPTRRSSDLPLAVNDQGELLACCLTPGNVDDRKPVASMVKKLRGKLFGDRGSISAPLTQLLFEQGLHLITRLQIGRAHSELQSQSNLVCRLL